MIRVKSVKKIEEAKETKKLYQALKRVLGERD
jgi:hypothetical protein